MKRLAVIAMVFGALLAVTQPAKAADTATLSLWTNWQPATITVNGKDVVVNSGYQTTPVQVPRGKVHLVAAAQVRLSPTTCASFSQWQDGVRTREHTIDVLKDHRSFIALYGGSC